MSNNTIFDDVFRTEATLEMELIMPDGKIVEYKVPILYLQKYTEDTIFQKNLFFLGQ